MRKPNVIRKLTVSEFIAEELDLKIGKLINEYPFLSFSLICMGIEFLGKCMDDEHTFECKDKGISKTQFNNCLKKYMVRYVEFIGKKNFDLYSNLRCGFAHKFRHGKKFSLAPITSTDKHLSILSDGKMVIRIDEFYNDFSSACKSVINDINNKVIKHKKVNSYYQLITD